MDSGKVHALAIVTAAALAGGHLATCAAVKSAASMPGW